jgi:cytochrome b subunit of formate dehydrogenase
MESNPAKHGQAAARRVTWGLTAMAALAFLVTACTTAGASTQPGDATAGGPAAGRPAGAATPQAVFRSNGLCIACHGKPGLVRKVGGGEQALETIDPQAFAASAHGQTPCAQCHTNQSAIPHPEAAKGQVAASIDETKVCSSCHREAYEGYSHTAHGIVGNLGDSRAPGCTDCHGAHNVARVRDWKSDERAQACARCHEGASGTFAAASIGHREPSASWFAPCCPYGFCPGVRHPPCRIGCTALGGRESANPSQPGERRMSTPTRLQGHTITSSQTRQATDEDYVVRFETHQRVQHFLMMSTFIVLALTGLPQRFSELGASQWWVSTLGGLEMVRTIHRTAGVIMLLDCVYHVGYLLVRIGAQRRFGAFQMIPTPKDVKDAFHMIRYFLGLEAEKPRFGRFSYLEKFDYWAVFWGIAVIGTSGVLLMFAVSVTKVLPGQAIPLATTVHGDEAVLAVGWIAIVHMFNAHLAPWVFPFNPAIFTGRLSRERYAEDHPLEYGRLTAPRPPVVVRQPEPRVLAPVADLLAETVCPAIVDVADTMVRHPGERAGAGGTTGMGVLTDET